MSVRSSTRAARWHAETWRRGATLYSPDRNTPLHPVELSEGAASLLPDRQRPAVLWTIRLDASGEPVEVDVRRTVITSLAQLDYPAVQTDADAGRLHPSIALLPEIGRLRLERSRERHAISLDIPDSEIVRRPGRALDAGAAGGAAGRAVQRRDQPADRDVRGVDHARRRNRAAADAAVTDRRAGRGAAENHCGAGHPVAGRRCRRATHRGPERRRAAGGGVPGGRGPVAARRRLHPVRRNRRSAANTAASARRTRTSRRRCAGWPTGSRPRSAWRCTPASRCPTGCRKRCRNCRRRWARPTARRPNSARACAGAVSVFVLHGREGEHFTATVLQLEPERGPGHRSAARAAGARALPAGRAGRGFGDHGAAGLRRPGDSFVRRRAGRYDAPPGRVDG